MPLGLLASSQTTGPLTTVASSTFCELQKSSVLTVSNTLWGCPCCRD